MYLPSKPRPKVRSAAHAFAEVEPLLRQVGEEEYACTVCEAVENYTITDLPSMMGYGHDTNETCNSCGAVQVDNPLTGGFTIWKAAMTFFQPPMTDTIATLLGLNDHSNCNHP